MQEIFKQVDYDYAERMFDTATRLYRSGAMREFMEAGEEDPEDSNQAEAQPSTTAQDSSLSSHLFL